MFNIRLRRIPTVRDVHLVVPSDGYSYVQIKHDFEFLGYPRQKDWGIKYPIPAMVNEVRLMFNSKTYDYVRLSREWQFFLFDLFKWSVGDTVPLGKWEGTYKNPSNPTMTFDKYTAGSLLWYYTEMIQDARSHTDADPPEEGFADYVTGRHITAKPYSWLCKTTTGNILRVLGSEGQYWRVEAIDLNQPVPNINDIVHKPWLLHWATEQSASVPYYVDRYPQAKIVRRHHEFPDSGTPIPNISLGGSYLILKTRTKKVEAGQPFSPYQPFK